MIRADLHVHSYHSGFSGSLRWCRSRDCYSSPEAVYQRAKARGMDAVTITDHNSIDGCLELLARHGTLPDFVVGEEVECLYPGTDLRIHIGVFGLDERVHREIQALRRNVFEAVALLRHEGLFFALFHPFHFYRGQVGLATYLAELVPLFPGIEARNGTMSARLNELTERVVTHWVQAGGRTAVVGGSDAHTLRSIGTTCTEVMIETPAALLEALKAGRSHVRGRHGSASRLAFDIYGVIFRFWAGLVGLGRHECSRAERTRSLLLSVLLSPFMVTPIVTSLLQKSGEARRARRLIRAWESGSPAAGWASVRRVSAADPLS